MEEPAGSAEASAPTGGLSVLSRIGQRVRAHKVLQWGLAYLGASLALAHGTELLSTAFHWPEIISRLVIGLLIVGFPIALALAWYHGHRSLTNFSAAEATIVSLLVVLGAGLLVVLVRAPQEHAEVAPQATAGRSVIPVASGPATAIPDASVAVLPFKDMSPGHDQDYFADGVTEEILNSLAAIPDLKVTGRTSSFAFKGRDVDLRTIGETLGVKNILEGSIRKEGNQLRITAQLNNAATGYHLWSQTYDRSLDDVFKIQEDIAGAVAKALQVSLGVGQLGHVPGMTRNVAAYDAYLAARDVGDVSPAALQRGIDSLERAVALDPAFVQAWLQLWNAYSWASASDAGLNGAPQQEWIAKADSAIEQVKRILPGSPLLQGVLADRSMNAFDWIAAQEDLDSIRSAPGGMSPTDIGTYENSAPLFMLLIGRTREAIPMLEHQVVRDPLSTYLSSLLSVAYTESGNLAAATSEQDRGFKLGAGRSFVSSTAFETALGTRDHGLIQRRLDSLDATPQQKALLRRLLDREPAALTELRRMLSVSANPVSAYTGPSSYNLVWSTVEWLAWYGDSQGALDVLRSYAPVARSQRRNGYTLNFWNPMLRNVRRLPGFKDLVRDLGLVDYWRRFGWADLCHPLGQSDFECD